MRNILVLILCLIPSWIVQEDSLPLSTRDRSESIMIRYPTAATYSVRADHLVERLAGVPHFYHEIMWKNTKLLVDIFGVADRIPEFQVFIEHSVTLAYVRPLDGGRSSQWRLAVNWEYDQDMAAVFRTELHELTHVLVDAGRTDESGCPVGLGNRSAHDRVTYLVPFLWQFWRDCMSSHPEKRAYKSDDYVTTYAPTSIEEDMAESAAAYLICGSNNSFRGAAKEKIAFFDGIPETRALYERIRREYSEWFLQSVREYIPEVCGQAGANPR